MSAVEELRVWITATFIIEDAAAKQRARQELAEGFLQRWAEQVSA